jgi:CPA2 family monovalent cation:H+ antiporter-2
MALVLTLLPGVIIWRNAHRCAERIAVSIYQASAHPDHPAEVDHESTNLLIRILETSIVFGAATLLLAIIAPLMSLFDGLAVMVIIVTGLLVAVWRIARDLYALMHTTSGALVQRLERVRELSPSNATEIADSVGVGALMWARVPNGSGAIGMKLGDLNLHAITGVSIMAIVRDGHSIVMPGSEEVLHAGDTLAMAGSTEAVAAARDILSLSSVMSLGAAEAVVQ